MRIANVTAKVHNKRTYQQTGVASTMMSTDLPAENLGEFVAGVIHEQTRHGIDPVDMVIVLEFS